MYQYVSNIQLDLNCIAIITIIITPTFTVNIIVTKYSLPSISLEILETLKRFSTISVQTEHQAARIHSYTVSNRAC